MITAKPLTINGVHHMLRNPYYMGVVPYRGVYHEGQHEPLVSSETWLRVQDVLSAHRLTGEKERKHPHYLKGTIFCGECGARLIYSENTGKSGGVYVYYVCLSHLTKRQPCTRKYVRLDKIEPAIEDFYRSLRLPADRAEVIRTGVMAELRSEREEAAQTKRRAEKRLKDAEEQRAKLLQAHYAGAVPLEMMKVEMDRLTRDLTEAQQAIADASGNVTNLEETLNLALEMAKDCANQYLVANPRIRRLINQGLFKKLYINEDGTVERFEMTEPFATLLDPELLEDLASTEPTTSALDESAAELPPVTERSDEAQVSLSRMFTCEKRTKKNQPDVSYVRLGSNMISLVHRAQRERPTEPAPASLGSTRPAGEQATAVAVHNRVSR